MTKPNYKGNGVAVWEGTTQDGKKKLSIKIVGHEYIYAYEEKESDEPAPTDRF